MMERGVIRTVRDGLAEVEVRPASQDACATCGSCADEPQGRLLEVKAAPGAEPGRRVLIEVRDEGGLGPAFVVFLLPVLALLIGAVLGSHVPSWTGSPDLSPTLAAILGALALLGLAILAVRSYDRAYGTKAGPRPRIVRFES